MAQVNSANFGTNAVAIVGKQTDFETQVSEVPSGSGSPKMRPEIVELRPPMTLQPVRGFYRADRMKGSPSPDPMVAGMQMGGGDINFFADPHTLAFWLGELLMYDVATSSIGFELPALAANIGSLTMVADTRNDSVGPLSQPGIQLEALTNLVATKSGATDLTVKRPTGLTAVQLEFGGAAAASGAVITVEGKDQNDTPMVDRVTSAGSTVKSSRWFREITAATSSIEGALTIKGDPETYFHRLKFTKKVNEGLTIEVHEGNQDTPATYAGAHIARGILSIEPVVRAMFRISANRAFPRQDITGGRDGTALTAANGFTRAKPNFVPDWGTSWEILDTPGVPAELVGQHRLAGGNFIIDNLLGPPATRFAETTTYPKNVRKANRDLMLAVQVDHHKDLDFDQFVGGDSFKSVYSAVSRQFGQRYQSIRFSADNTQLVSFPSRPIMNLAEVLANLAIRMNIGTAAEGNDEATLEIFNDSATL